jgi:hypothetical protein
MVSVVAFLCALALSPAACDRATAVDVITFPPAANELACMRDAQMTLAGLAIRADPAHRWVVKCARGNGGLGPVG